MRAVVLAAATTVSRARVAEILDTLRSAAGREVIVDLFSWRPVETGAGLNSTTVLGPVTVYTPPRPDPGSVPGPAPGPAPGSTPGPRPPEGERAVPVARAGWPSPRLMAGRGYWGMRRRVIRVRRGRPYQKLRRVVRGGIARQFATTVRRTPPVLTAARDAQIIVALDSGAVAAAWWVARRVPGPPVVSGLAAAERELRAAAGPVSDAPAR